MRSPRLAAMPVLIPVLVLALLSLCAVPADACTCSGDPVVAALAGAAYPLDTTEPGGGKAGLQAVSAEFCAR